MPSATHTTALQSTFPPARTLRRFLCLFADTFVIFVTVDQRVRVRFEFCCTGHRERSRTFSKVVLSVDGALTFRGRAEGPGQFEYARHNAGAPRPARRTARDRQLGRRSPCAYPRPPLTVDPSASHAHPPSLMLQPPTACAWSTLSQAQISRASPLAVSAAPRADTRRWPLFCLLARGPLRRVAARRAPIVSPLAWWGDLGRPRYRGVERRAPVCGSGSGAATPADAGPRRALCVDRWTVRSVGPHLTVRYMSW